MPSSGNAPFAAAEQGLGYIYQGRFALYKILSLPENYSVVLEKEDDVEFTAENGKRSLGSLKHKAEGDTLTDLSVDFWKSVRVWLAHYISDGKILCNSQFFLFTTAVVSEDSSLSLFLDGAPQIERADQARTILENSTSQIITTIRNELTALTTTELEDFYGRITIIDAAPRITELPRLIIDKYLRAVRREARTPLFQRLEGWWTDTVIQILSGERKEPVSGQEVSDKLSTFAEEYRSDNLPITFRNRRPDSTSDISNDDRLFVQQLQALDLPVERIQSAILDYYRAFEQRSSWARESLLISGEIEDYENRLADEWSRYKALIFEKLDDKSAEAVCLDAGKEVYRWAEFETSNLRIRERVTEPYVIRGTFHILANGKPNPRVYWHPRFLQRLGQLLGIAA